MSYSKRKVLFFFPVVFLAAAIVFGRAYFIKFEEEARVAFERGDFCESFEKSLKASFVVEYSKQRIGRFYAAGICVEQNFTQATLWLAKFYNNDSKKMAADFFYAAQELGNIFGLNPAPQIHHKMVETIKKSLELGFIPSERDMSLFPDSAKYLEEAKRAN